MLKLKILPSMATLGYHLYIYEEDSQGNIRVAKPFELEFEDDFKSRGSGEWLKPTLALPLSCEIVSEVEKNFTTRDSDMLKQKESDKGAHIENLNEIIKMLVGRDD